MCVFLQINNLKSISFIEIDHDKSVIHFIFLRKRWRRAMAAAHQEGEDDGGTRIVYQHHARKLLLALNDTRKNPDLCDAYVTINCSQIPVQKSVLSAASQYLRFVCRLPLFTNKFACCYNVCCLELPPGIPFQ